MKTTSEKTTKPKSPTKNKGKMKKVVESISHLFRFLSWMAVLTMWACAASVYVSPAEWGKYFGVFGLCFPFCVGAVIVIGLVSLLFKPRLICISLFGLLCCIGTIRDYFPLNFSSPPPKGCLKVISYNTMDFGLHKVDSTKNEYLILSDILSRSADIINMQETCIRTDEQVRQVERAMRRHGYHYLRQKLGKGNFVAVASRIPIVDSGVICQSTTNGAAYFRLCRKTGDTLTIVNTHLETTRTSKEDRSKFYELAKNPETADTIRGKMKIVRSLAEAAVERAHQADTLARFLDQNKGKRIILTGDFNDTPVSYAHHKVCARLTDCFRATANGLGRTYNKNAMFVRIDHVFCSDHWKPYAAQVDESATQSDHYPIIFYLKEKK